MVLALALRSGTRAGRPALWLLATALLGSVFLGGQYYEFTTFYHEGMKLTGTNVFGSAFFTLTGFHGAHVTIGVIWLLSLFVHGRAGKAARSTRPQRRDRRALLALRRHRLDHHLHRRLPARVRPVGEVCP